MLPAAMHARAGGDFVPRLALVPEMLSAGATDDLLTVIKDATRLLVDYRHIFENVRKVVDVDEFYDVYRPLLSGFSPRGARLCGVSAGARAYAEESIEARGEGEESGGQGGATVVGAAAMGAAVAGAADGTGREEGERDVVVRAKGPSAGQSTIIALLDMVLGVHHGEQVESGQFQKEMISVYMPPPHRALMLDTREALNTAVCRGQPVPTIRAYVDLFAPSLRTPFNEAVDAMSALRRFHLDVAMRYLVRTKKGTGTSTFRSLLAETLDDTTNAKLGEGGGVEAKKGRD